MELNKTTKNSLIIVFLALAFSCVFSEKTREQIKTPKISDSEFENYSEKDSIKTTKGILISKKTRINYGKIKKGDTIKQLFSMVNEGTEDVRILGYIPSCDCTAMRIEKMVISPRDSIKIEMIVATNDKILGKNSVTATLKTNGQKALYLLMTKFEVIE